MVGIQSHFSTHPLVTRFRQILQDVATYYTKKLDMLKIKLEHHQNTKPNAYHVQLAKDLMEVYRGQTDWDQLWKDMFCRWKERITISFGPYMSAIFHFRLLGGPPYKSDVARQVQNWLREARTIRSGIRACIQDLHRERDKVG